MKFTWGDAVRIVNSAASPLRAGAYAAVVGVNDATGSYTVEYEDVTDANEVSESLLERLDG